MIGYERFLKLRETEGDSASLNKVEQKIDALDKNLDVQKVSEVKKEITQPTLEIVEAKVKAEQEEAENQSEDENAKTDGGVSPVSGEKGDGAAISGTNAEEGAEEKEVESQEALTNLQTEQVTNKNIAGGITATQNLNQTVKQPMGTTPPSITTTTPTESEQKEVEFQEQFTNELASRITPVEELKQDVKQQMGTAPQSITTTTPPESEEKETENQEQSTNALDTTITPVQGLKQDIKQPMGTAPQSTTTTTPPKSEEKEDVNQQRGNEFQAKDTTAPRGPEEKEDQSQEALTQPGNQASTSSITSAQELKQDVNQQMGNVSQSKISTPPKGSEENKQEAEQDSTTSQVKNVVSPPPLPPKKINLDNVALNEAKRKSFEVAKRESLKQGNNATASSELPKAVIAKETTALLDELKSKDPSSNLSAKTAQSGDGVGQVQKQGNANAQTQSFRKLPDWVPTGAAKMMDKYPSTGAFLKAKFNSAVEAVKKAVNPVFRWIYSRDIKKAQEAADKLPTIEFDKNHIIYRNDYKLLESFYKNDFKRGILERSENKNDEKLLSRIRDIVDPKGTLLNKDKVSAEEAKQNVGTSAKRTSP